VTILIVVLDEDVRDLIRNLLERSQRDVVIAADEDEAVELARSAQIDLLLTEVAPSLDGRSLAERLRASVPELPVLYVTGWFDHPDFAELQEETLVKEPFSRDQLIRAIDAVLGAAT
jgi:two-component system cell cycle sensor histidine kinase/response regulator CckA